MILRKWDTVRRMKGLKNIIVENLTLNNFSEFQ